MKQEQGERLEPNFALTQTELIFPRNIKVDVYGVVHNASTLQAREQIGAVIRNHSFIMVETDVDYLSRGKKTEFTGFNNALMHLAWENRKTVICSDPLAETEDMGLIDNGLLITGVTTETALITSLAVSQPRKMTRRTFLKLVGIGVTGTILAGTMMGDLVELIGSGFDGTTKHPKIVDSISYDEFRNTTSLLGFNTLIEQRALQTNDRGALFIGAMHVNDLRGYTVNGIVDLHKVLEIYQNNLYTLALSKLNRLPTVRVWTPVEQNHTFLLQQAEIIP